MSFQSVVIVLFGLTALCLASQADPKHWALIVAGSNNWYNYRHQVCAAFSFRFRFIREEQETDPDSHTASLAI